MCSAKNSYVNCVDVVFFVKTIDKIPKTRYHDVRNANKFEFFEDNCLALAVKIFWQLLVRSTKGSGQRVVLGQTVFYVNGAGTVENVERRFEGHTNLSVGTVPVKILQECSAFLEMIQFAVHLGTAARARKSVLLARRVLGESVGALGDAEFPWFEDHKGRIAGRVTAAANGAVAVDHGNRISICLEFHRTTVARTGMRRETATARCRQSRCRCRRR